jgi:hypothetical protein
VVQIHSPAPIISMSYRKSSVAHFLFAASLLHCRMNYPVFLGPTSHTPSFAATSVLLPPSVVGLLRAPKLAARFRHRAPLAQKYLRLSQPPDVFCFVLPLLLHFQFPIFISSPILTHHWTGFRGQVTINILDRGLVV